MWNRASMPNTSSKILMGTLLSMTLPHRLQSQAGSPMSGLSVNQVTLCHIGGRFGGVIVVA